MSETYFDTVCVVGTGLLGGSLALALKASQLCGRVVGVDLDDERLNEAKALSIIDASADAPVRADLVIVAVPGPAIAEVVAAVSDSSRLIIDVGSVKAPIVDALARSAEGVPPHFVPCHPMAGSEKSGPAAASATLFTGQTVILTPSASTSDEATATVRSIWESAGAAVREMSPDGHDTAVAVTSHLPHLLAFAFAGLVEPEHLPVTGPGFRDFTRIARSDPEVWQHILSFNRDHLLDMADNYLAELTKARALLADGDDPEAFAQWLRERANRSLR